MREIWVMLGDAHSRSTVTGIIILSYQTRLIKRIQVSRVTGFAYTMIHPGKEARNFQVLEAEAIKELILLLEGVRREKL